MFNSIFGGDNQSTIEIWVFLLCILISLIDGLMYMFSFSFRNPSKKNFKTALCFFATSCLCSYYDGKWKHCRYKHIWWYV